MAATDRRRTPRPGPNRWVTGVIGWFDPGEPHQARGPFARWPRAADTLLAAVVFMASLAAVGLSALDDDQDVTIGSVVDRPAGAAALLAAWSTALWWRRSRPVVVTVVLLAGMLLWALLASGDGQDLPLVVALYSVGRYHTDHRSSMAVLAAAVAVGMVGTVIDPNQRVDLVPAVVLTVLPWYVGRRVRNRGDYVALLQDRARRLEADQQRRARQAVIDERARIARELHDVVAHRVSMMTVQAGAARTIAPHDLDAALEAIGDTERAGRQALGELRHLLGVLRPDGIDVETGDIGPHPGLADVPALVDEHRRAGAQIELVVARLPEPVLAPVDLAAYRIVQESLTNVVKHAGPEAVADVSIVVEAGDLVIVVGNTVPHPGRRLPGSGYGILGMRERAASLGGTLDSGPDGPDRFRVVARLPLEPDPL